MASNILLFVPAYGQIWSAATGLCTHQVAQLLNSRGIGGGISSLSFPDISEVRAMITSIWYDTMPQCTHMLFIDNDMSFPPDMVLDMLLLDEPIVGSIYRHRQDKVTWVGSGTGDKMTERRGN